MNQTTRRRFLTTSATLAVGGIALTTLPKNSQATSSVTMQGLSVADASRTLSQPPSAVTLTVDGTYTLEGTRPEQSRVVAQVEHNAVSRDMDEVINMEDVMSGDYTLSADLLAHPEVDAEALLPESVDGTTGTEFTIRCILLAVLGGQIQSEAVIEDTATLSLTKDGVELSVSGSGGITVSAQ